MSVTGARATAARETIAALCADPPGPAELVAEVADRVRVVLPYDTGAWMTTDPETLLPSRVHAIDSSADLGQAFARAELLAEGPDVHSFGELLRTGQAASALSIATGGDLESNARFRDIHVPNNLSDELRLVARSGAETWALACVTRADDAPRFTADEVQFAASIADLLGTGIRTSLARAPVDPDALRAPGMLVLTADGAVEASTGEADRWLTLLEAPFPGVLPTAITAVALQAQANAAGAGTARAARLRVQTPGGAWLLVHADVLAGAHGSAGRIAVVLEPADRAVLVPLLLALHGLSSREREVAELLVCGIGTAEIAARLHISRHTLRDHVKAIFAKVRVTSRAELTAALAQQPLAA